MTSNELNFTGHLTPPDIQTYQQFSNQSEPRNRVTPLVLDGIDGRLNPEAFYFKARSASKRRAALELTHNTTTTTTTSSSSNLFQVPVFRQSIYPRNDPEDHESFLANRNERRNFGPIKNMVETYMRQQVVKSAGYRCSRSPQEANLCITIPEPSLHTWRLASEVVGMIQRGQLTWKQVKNNFQGQEASRQEIERFCQLSALQKRTLHFEASKLGYLVQTRMAPNADKVEDRWGVIRSRHGPFWPLGLGPLCSAPKLRDSGEFWDSERRRRVRGRVLAHLEHLFTGQPIGEELTFQRPIVVFDTELSPPMDVRIRKARALRSSDDEQLRDELIFESRFECGNLRQARRIGAYEYELVLTPDLVTQSHVQWFFFQVAGAKTGVEYTFRIVNLLKNRRLIKSGEKVLFHSKKLAEKTGNGWTRVGTDTSYERNMTSGRNPLLKKDVTYYELKFKMAFPFDEDLCVFAHCYPYTYSDLKEDLEATLERSRKLPAGTVKCGTLCSTFAGNTCFLLTITDPSIPDSEKYAAIITARVHPGETVASWNMKGLMEFLTHPHNETARELRQRFVFKLVPMLNADGVIVGNYRCSLIGRDVNRTYNVYGPDQIPEVHHTRNLVQFCRENFQEVIFCDFHGHSQAFNAFIYGTDSGYRSSEAVVSPKTYLTDPRQFLIDRMIPFLISKEDPRRFCFRSCRFSLQSWREGCARISLWRKFNLTHCFTMETSLFGTNLEPGSGFRYFDRADLQTLGKSFALALLAFHKIQSSPGKMNQLMVEMGKSLLRDVFLTRITASAALKRVRSSESSLSRNSSEVKLNTTSIYSVDDFASALGQFGGDLLEEGTDVASSSSASSDDENDDDNKGGGGGGGFTTRRLGKRVGRRTTTSASTTIAANAVKDMERSSQPRRRRRRGRRKHRTCRRRRKNRRRHLKNLQQRHEACIHQSIGPIEFRPPPAPHSAPRCISLERKRNTRKVKPQNLVRHSSLRTVLKLPLRSPALFDLEATNRNH